MSPMNPPKHYLQKRNNERLMKHLESECLVNEMELIYRRNQIEHLTSSPLALKIVFDENSEADTRSAVALHLVFGGFRITGIVPDDESLTRNTKLTRQFAIIFQGKPGNPKEVILLIFSKELGDLEISTVEIRAKLLSLAHGVEIKEIKRIENLTPDQLSEDYYVGMGDLPWQKKAGNKDN